VGWRREGRRGGGAAAAEVERRARRGNQIIMRGKEKQGIFGEVGRGERVGRGLWVDGDRWIWHGWL